MIKLLFDTKLNRPGCVILQALANGSREALFEYFSSEDWLTAPTPDMKIMHGTPEQWERVSTRNKPCRKL